MLSAEIGERALSGEQLDALHDFVCSSLLPAFGVSEETTRSDVELWDVLSIKMDGIARLHKEDGSE
ncbi:MAG: hypothetical protein AAF676_08380 [Pseudomonadota bacterium]